MVSCALGLVWLGDKFKGFEFVASTYDLPRDGTSLYHLRWAHSSGSGGCANLSSFRIFFISAGDRGEAYPSSVVLMHYRGEGKES